MGNFIILHRKENNNLVGLNFGIMMAVSESGDGSVIHYRDYDQTAPILVNESVSQITKKIETMGVMNKPPTQPFLWLHKASDNTRVVLPKSNIQLVETSGGGTRIAFSASHIKPLFVNESVTSIVARLND